MSAGTGKSNGSASIAGEAAELLSEGFAMLGNWKAHMGVATRRGRAQGHVL